MESLIEYLQRSFKIAWKSILYNFKQYLCFFAAIFIVQMFYGLISIAADNNNSVEYKHIKEEYDYHMVLNDLNADQYTYLKNGSGSVFVNDNPYTIVREEQSYNHISMEDVFDVYLLFNGTGNQIYKGQNRFMESYHGKLMERSSDGKTLNYSVTPLLDFNSNEQANTAKFMMLSVVLLVVSIFLLTSLFNIRVNQYKFTYGVYMTFGADFKKLFGTAFWELFMISVVTFIPSMAISTGVVAMIFIPSGYGFAFNVLSIFKVALFSLVVVLASVYMPMRLTSLKQPMSLIVTEDNSNLVTSPMHSFNIYGKKFPTTYEFYSLWRFRKHSVQLVFTAVIFCALFIVALYFSEIQQANLDYYRPQFTVDLSNTKYSYDDIMSDELYAIDGIKEVEAMGSSDSSSSVKALYVSSHILVESSDVLPLKNLVNYSGTAVEGNYKVTNDVLYRLMTEEQLKILEKYEVEGDLNSIFQNENTIIVGDSITNIKTFDYKVGDKIKVAVYKDQMKAVDKNESGRTLLKSQLKYFVFEYVEYTIGAIVRDIPSAGMPVFLTPEAFETVTKDIPEIKLLNVYVDDDTTVEEVKTIEQKIREWGRTYGYVKVKNQHRVSLNNIEQDKHYSELYTCIALLILVISPLVWFFSQSLFYMKRETEFNIIQSMGAILKDIRQIYLQGGVFMSMLSALFAVILSYAGSYGIFYLFNVVMPYFAKENVRYFFYMPWYAILTSILVSVLCGFFSAYFPFRSYYKNRYSLLNGGRGEFGDD